MNRREFLAWTGRVSLALAAGALAEGAGPSAPLGRSPAHAAGAGPRAAAREGSDAAATLFLAGDVMTGRGIDQVLATSVDPRLYEPYVRDARRYVELAEEANGPIPRPLPYERVWGDALAELDRAAPHARIVNLETAVTTNDEPWPGKGIHYRMHPDNVELLSLAGLDVCVLGNNHVMDWGEPGLRETLEVLEGVGIATPGAGRNEEEAASPAVVETEAGRLLVFSYGTTSAGVPPDWRAGGDRIGVNHLPDLSTDRAERVADHVHAHRREGDHVVISIHWGGNWGYEVPEDQRSFARALVDAGAADVVHGHSSHHPKGIEVHGGRPILYGVGDLLNDYEGIGGHEEYRPELSLLYFPRLDRAGDLISLEMTPMRIRRFGLERADEDEVEWLARRLDRESGRFGSGVRRTDEGRLALEWG